MANRTRTHSDKSDASSLCCLTGHAEMEYFWCIELNATKRCVQWVIQPEDAEDEDDDDFINHTVIVKMAVLDASAVAGEQNIVMFESDGQDGEMQKGTIANLTRGLNPMAILNFTVQGKIGGVFTLAEGSGPVVISGNHLLEFPSDDNEVDASQCVDPGNGNKEDKENKEDNKENDDDDDDDEDDDDDDNDDSDEKGKGKKSIKRKAPSKASKQKKVKMEDSDDNEDENEEEEESEDDDDDDDDYEEVKNKKGKKAKQDSGKKAKTKAKVVKDSGKKSTKKMK